MSKVLQGALRQILEKACEEHKACLSEFTVLSEQIDPYRLDTLAGHRDGVWAKQQLQRFYGPTKQAHWRGLHYSIIMAKRKVRKPNGEIFHNTHENWKWLVDVAGKAARWLKYIPFDRIIDQRNSPPVIHRHAKVEPAAGLHVGLSVEIPDADDIDPAPYAVGFDPRQAFHFVIFGEKSSLEEIVDPIAEAKQADLYLPTGEISDTLIYQIAKDANEDGRPMVMFTLSDCDPSGWQMPVSIARKLQAFRDLLFPNLKFEVVPIAVTPDHVREYDLPEEPVKPGDPRAKAWKEAFGVDQTEIDSLTTPEMQQRGLFRDIIETAFDRYLDHTLEARVYRSKDEWLDAAQQAVSEQIDAEQLEQIRDEAAAKLEEMREQIEQINEQLDIVVDGIILPPVEVPQPNVALDPERHALVSFDDDWVTATRKLIKRKAYSKSRRPA